MGDLLWSDVLELFGWAVAAALVAGVVCPQVGLVLLVRRTGFYGVALPQFAAAGVAFGFASLGFWTHHFGLFGLDEESALLGTHLSLTYHLFWAAVFTFGGLAALSAVTRAAAGEAGWVAAAFALASALAILFAHASAFGAEYVHSLLRGEILAIGVHEFDTLAAVLGLVLLVLFLRRRDLLLVSFDREWARVLGKRVVGLELLLLLATGATVAVGVMTVGPVVLFGLLVVPPLGARALARSMRGFQIAASVLGFASALLGVWASFRFEWPLGPAVVVAACVLLGLAQCWAALRGRLAGSETRP